LSRSPLSRREFTALAAGVAASPFAFGRTFAARAAPITAQDVIDRIRKNVGVAWKADTVDTLKAGDPAAAVKGIATASMATLDVLQRAVKANANFVITFEPTFFSKSDSPTSAPGRGQMASALIRSSPPRRISSRRTAWSSGASATTGVSAPPIR
jgi:hypothetical protein